MDVLIGWPGGDWQGSAKLAGVLVGGYLLILWLATILWAYRDTRGRTRDPLSQLIGVALVTVFPFVGLPVYLVVRPAETLRQAYERQLEQEAILSELHATSACPNCRRPVQDDFMVCAYCQTSLREACRSCSHLLSSAWRVCPYCATPRERHEHAPPGAAPGAEEPAGAASGAEVESRPGQSRTAQRTAAPEDTTGSAPPRPPVSPSVSPSIRPSGEGPPAGGPHAES